MKRFFDLSSKASLTFEIAMLAVAFLIVGFGAWEATKLPLYPDEIAFRIYLERFFVNGWVKQSLTPFCSGFRVPVPWPLLPAAIGWSGLHRLGPNWLSFRILPLASLGFAVITITINGVLRGDRGIWRSVLIFLAGPAIYGLIIFRPEIVMLAASILIFFLARTVALSSRYWLVMVLSAAQIMLFDFLAFMHPKSIYLVPLIAISLVFACRNQAAGLRRWVMVVVSTAVVFLIAESAIRMQTLQLLSCSQSPSFQKFMMAQSVNLLDVFGNLSKLKSDVGVALSSKLSSLTIARLQFQSKYEIGYLPDGSNTDRLVKVANVFILLTVAGSLAYVIVKPFRLLFSCPGRELRRELMLFVALSAALLFPAFANVTRHWYEAAWLIGTLAVLVGILRPLSPVQLFRGDGGLCDTFAGMIVLAASSLSLFVISTEITPSLDAYSGPGMPIKFDFRQIAATVISLEQKYNVGEKRPVVVDDLTYGALSKHPIVAPITYLGHALDTPDVLATTLRRLGVTVSITRCKTAPILNQVGWTTRTEVTDPGSGEEICLLEPPDFDQSDETDSNGTTTSRVRKNQQIAR